MVPLPRGSRFGIFTQIARRIIEAVCEYFSRMQLSKISCGLGVVLERNKLAGTNSGIKLTKAITEIETELSAAKKRLATLPFRINASDEIRSKLGSIDEVGTNLAALNDRLKIRSVEEEKVAHEVSGILDRSLDVANTTYEYLLKYQDIREDQLSKEERAYFESTVKGDWKMGRTVFVKDVAVLFQKVTEKNAEDIKELCKKSGVGIPSTDSVRVKADRFAKVYSQIIGIALGNHDRNRYSLI